MRRAVIVAALTLGTLWGAGLAAQEPAPAEALQGDPAAGEKLAGQCRTCHGIDGLARIPIAPHIAGEPAGYLARQLTDFREGRRQHEMMSVVAASLTDQQIADLAAWYAGRQVVAELTADPAGAPEACIACHGADGIAVIPEAPNLAAETNIYLDTQLKAFRSGKRVNEIMQPIAEGLDDATIRAAADWYGAIRLTVAP
ncbi:c-type cytochrome [Paracoccus zhejiangensis]|uniref:Cytochrome C n=1 Tax=Paracoccus zhejiangensis TaxID=1077935 RepID=A0A2H5EY87_9RHOB|nr:c-type cytochrome [Paracoccus zhejiangensis]AUH64269.1 cytochrome C [Paracoccus zhejiangensis]